MNATSALGWALVHFVWQGAALAVLLALGLAATRRAAAQTRYTLSLLTLVAMLIVPLATGIGLYNRRPSIAGSPRDATPLQPLSAFRSPSPSPSRSPSPSPSPAPSASQTAVPPRPRRRCRRPRIDSPESARWSHRCCRGW